MHKNVSLQYLNFVTIGFGVSDIYFPATPFKHKFGIATMLLTRDDIGDSGEAGRFRNTLVCLLFTSARQTLIDHRLVWALVRHRPRGCFTNGVRMKSCMVTSHQMKKGRAESLGGRVMATI